MRVPSYDASELERAIGPRGETIVNSANRAQVQNWLCAQGIPSERAKAMKLNTLWKCYNRPRYLAAVQSHLGGSGADPETLDTVEPLNGAFQPSMTMPEPEPPAPAIAQTAIAFHEPAPQPSDAGAQLAALIQSLAAGAINEARVLELIAEHAPRPAERVIERIVVANGAEAHDYARLGFRTQRANDQLPAEWWGETFAAAIDLARFGWPAGRDAIMQAMAIIFPEREATPERFHDVAGAYPDVPRAVAGDPVSMINLRPSSRAARPVVRIDYGRSTLSDVPAAAITNRGAALLGIVDALEARGYSVELRLIFKTEKPAAAYHSAVVLKQAGEPLDIDRAAFALINPAVLRRLAFAMREQHKPLETAFGSSMGHSDYTPLEPSEETIFVPAATGDDLDPDRARRRIEQLFAEARP